MDSDKDSYDPPRRWFRPADVILVIAILVLVIGYTLPALRRVQGRGLRNQCQNNMRQVTLGTLQAEIQHKRMPPAWGDYANKRASLFFHILPFIEEAGVYALYSADTPNVDLFFNNLNGLNGTPLPIAKLPVTGPGRSRIPVYQCASDTSSRTPGLEEGWGTSNFAANWLVFHPGTIYVKDEQQAVIPGVVRIPETFKDGASRTILFAEKYAVCGSKGGSRWAYPPAVSFNATSPPDNYGSFFAFRAFTESNPFGWSLERYQEAPQQGECRSNLAQTPHTGGTINLAMGDGSVRSVSGLTVGEDPKAADPVLAMQATVALQLGSTSLSWRASLTPSGIGLKDGIIGPWALDVVANDWD